MEFLMTPDFKEKGNWFTMKRHHETDAPVYCYYKNKMYTIHG